MKVLVAYASKYGSTKGIAEFIGQHLSELGLQVDVMDVTAVKETSGYDAFVIGSAVFIGHWMKEAKEFLSRNQTTLLTKPVWLFSSGPTGHSETDKKGRKLREVSGPSEIAELRARTNPRDHHVFFGAFFPEKVGGMMGWFGRMAPKEDQGDFRDWNEIGNWAEGIARMLSGIPA